MVGLAPAIAAPSGKVVRIATFNCSLNRPEQGGLIRSLSTPDDLQARAVAGIVQRVRPDILLLQEFDYDPQGEALRLFESNYLARAQDGAKPLEFEYSFTAASNTGVPSGFDLDHDGKIGGGGDALGFGEFPASTAWPYCRTTGSTRPRCAPSANSCGATCRARCCPMIPPRRRRMTGTRPRCSASCRCRRSRTGICR